MPILGDQDHVDHGVHGDGAESEWDPAPGLTEIVDAQGEERANAQHHHVRPQDPEHVYRCSVVRSERDIDYRRGPDDDRNRQHELKAQHDSQGRSERRDVGLSLLVSGEAGTDSGGQRQRHVLGQRYELYRGVECPRRRRVEEGADQQDVDIAEGGEGGVDHEDRPGVPGDAPGGESGC